MTVLTQLSAWIFQEPASPASRILLVVLAAGLSHVLIRIIGGTSEWVVMTSHRSKGRLWSVAQTPKVATLLRLAANTATWVIYFVAVGLILEEAGVNLAAYLASASIIGLAISFGSQSLVQDMVVGLTLLFSDAMEVDDIVEIAGAVVVVGRVQEIGLRFTKVINLYDQVVFIPNRTIANVSKYPAGGVFAFADIQVPAGAEWAKVTAAIRSEVDGMRSQFGALILEADVLDPASPTGGNQSRFLRVRFKVWPGQGGLIETTFRQRILRVLREFDPGYAEWEVPVFYRAPHSGGKVA